MLSIDTGMFAYPNTFDVVVIGGGHAGIEAATASALIGCRTLLITMNIDSIGQMSCNPAIGGLAKGQLVREVDALGGQMGILADLSGIQFRMLNSSKGPSVQAPRAQCDKKAYQTNAKLVVESAPNLCLTQAKVEAVFTKSGSTLGVTTDIGVEYDARTVVLTSGTFLSGLMHIGSARIPGGRAGDAAANGLSACLKDLGFELGRMKTGTSPRLLRRSIDVEVMQTQEGDDPPPVFSHTNDDLFHVELSTARTTSCVRDSARKKLIPILSKVGKQLPCYITYTTEDTARIVLSNLEKSPLCSGNIKGVGPRYCPSIEDKIMRFRDRERHQLFLEPEGITTDEVYVNGLSTSMPFDVQIDLVRSIIGCESADILRPGYAVEYDFIQPTQLYTTLESKIIRNLYFAGQINGTSGYEEAAAQGIIAGINAAMRVLDKSQFSLSRSESYIGVMIDDLTTKGTSEPYRMFTSRAENRLSLRQDNADLRLSHLGFEMGLISKSRYALVQAKAEAIARELTRLEMTRTGSVTLAQILRRSGVRYHDLPSRNESLPDEVIKQVEIEVKYSGYMARQAMEVERLSRLEGAVIPPDVNYDMIASLRTEAKQKFARIRPTTIGQAARISGVSPADVGVLMIWLRKNKREFSIQTVRAGTCASSASPIEVLEQTGDRECGAADSNL